MTVHKLQVMSHPTWQIARRPWTESPRANLAAHETKWNVPLKESPGIDIATGAVKYTKIKHRILFPTLNAKTILLLRYKNEICKLFSWTDKKPWFIIIFSWVFINLRIPRVAAIKFQKDSNMQIRLFVFYRLRRMSSRKSELCESSIRMSVRRFFDGLVRPPIHRSVTTSRD